MSTFILIMVLSTYTPRPLVVTAEFNSLATCEAARKHIAKSVSFQVQAQGCYKK